MAKPKTKVARRTKKSAKKRFRAPTAPPRASSKLDQIEAALRAAKGATLSGLMTLTGWQQHSVRGALAGALKQRGLEITSSKDGAERVHRIEARR